MKAKEVMNLLHISRGTLYNYTKSGIIKGTKLSNGYYNYDENSVFAFIKKDFRMSVVYSRVSSYKQKDDLVRQTKSIKNFCSNNNISVDKIYSEIASGTNLDRPKLNDLINDVISLKIHNIYISHRDRLTRLSFKTLEFIFSKFNTHIIVINDNESNKYNDNEIFEELISLMHIFSTSMYSNRRRNKINIYKQDIENFISTDK